MATIRFLCVLVILGCSSLFAEFTEAQPNMYRGVSLSDTCLLKDFSELTFFFYVPNADKPTEKLAFKELQKFGKVFLKRFSGEWPFVDKEERFINLPSLTYELINLQDMQGNLLPILQATLSISAPVDITKTNIHGSTTLWYASCYVHGNTEHDLSKHVKETLPSLLSQFSKAFEQANQPKSIKPVFYFAE